MQSVCNQTNCQACPVRMVCRCLKVTEKTLVDAVRTLNLRTLSDVRQHTGAGDGCMCCHRLLDRYLAENA